MPDNTAATGRRVEMTAPDGTVNKIYFVGSAGNSRLAPRFAGPRSDVQWRRWQRKVMTTWTQDNTSVFYPLNPRVTETNVYDPAEIELARGSIISIMTSKWHQLRVADKTFSSMRLNGL